MSLDQCALFRELFSHIFYQVVISTKLVICCAGVGGLVYQWCKQGVRFLVHENSKVEFQFYYALNVYAGTTFIFSYIFELFRGMAGCATFSAHHIIVLLSIERFYSSIFPSHFEKNSSKRLAIVLSIFVISVTWIYSFSCFTDRFTLLFETNLVALFDDRSSKNMIYFDEFATIALVSTAISLFIFSMDIYFNFIRKSRDINPSLAISYQRSENRRVLLTLLPIEIADGLIALFFTVTEILHVKFGSGTYESIGALLFMELTDYTMLISLYIAIIIELRVARRNREIVTTAPEHIDHFEQLRQAWN